MSILLRDFAEDEFGVFYWPMCPIRGCENRVTHNSKYCWPHTGCGKSPEQLMDELTREPEMALASEEE